MIYLDNNATTKIDARALRVMQRYSAETYANPSSLHVFGEKSRTALIRARESIASRLGCLPDELLFTASGSEGNNFCIKGFAEANRSKGRHIITSSIEHPSVLAVCAHLESEGFAITYLQVDSEGFVSIDELKSALRVDTILVSIMHANNEIGTIQPIYEIADVCYEHGVAFHTDAVQSFLKVPLHLQHPGITFATFSAHKVHGPKGVGAVFRRSNIVITRQIDGGDQEFGLRAGTENVPGIVAFAAAIENYTEGDTERMREQQSWLMTVLQGMAGVRVNGPTASEMRVCNNINVSFLGIEGERLLHLLSDRGFAVSTGSACSSRSSKVSPVLRSIGVPVEFIHGNIRISISKYTKMSELKKIVKELRKILGSTETIAII